jgi:FkbM family methyltransferase
MLINANEVMRCLNQYNISIHGVLHVGAHDCEELGYYNTIFKLPSNNIVWIDAIQEKVSSAFSKGIPNVYLAVVSDKDNDTVTFNITNNAGMSSSILELGTCKERYPSIQYVQKRTMTTTTLDTFFKRRSLNPQNYDFWNFDIQGAELLALKGGVNALQHVKAVYLEINTEHIYKDCALVDEIDTFLAEHGFKRVITRMTPHGWGDALYVRTSM